MKENEFRHILSPFGKNSIQNSGFIDFLIYLLKYWVRKTKKLIRNAVYLEILMPNDAY